MRDLSGLIFNILLIGEGCLFSVIVILRKNFFLLDFFVLVNCEEICYFKEMVRFCWVLKREERLVEELLVFIIVCNLYCL